METRELLDRPKEAPVRPNVRLHPPRVCEGEPSLENHAEARVVADLHARSAVGWKPWLGGFDGLVYLPTDGKGAES
jgi:hypothetical protein